MSPLRRVLPEADGVALSASPSVSMTKRISEGATNRAAGATFVSKASITTIDTGGDNRMG